MSPWKSLKHPLLLALALGVPPLVPATASAHQVAEIVTRGSGQVEVEPDSVRVDLGAEAQAATLDEARQQASTAMQRVIDAMHALDLPGLTITTRQVRFNPVYAPPKIGSAPAIVGYSASNHVLVTAERAAVGDLATRASKIVDAAMTAGANNVGGIEFYLADPSEAQDQALTLAVESARHDAETIAKASGVSIVKLSSLEESTASRMPRSLSIALEAAPASTPIEVGSITIESDVTARFSFR